MKRIMRTFLFTTCKRSLIGLCLLVSTLSTSAANGAITGGINVTNLSVSDPGDGTWAWDADSATLTLNDYNGSAIHISCDAGDAITVDVTGNSLISGSGAQGLLCNGLLTINTHQGAKLTIRGYATGIQSKGAITIIGDGEVEVVATTKGIYTAVAPITIDLTAPGQVTAKGEMGIDAGGTLSITGAVEVEAISTSLSFTVGIRASDDISITDGQVRAKSHEIGIYAYKGLSISGNSFVTTEETGTPSVFGYGIKANTLDISGSSEVKATSANSSGIYVSNDITINTTGVVTVSSKSRVPDLYGATIAITKGTVIVSNATETDAIDGTLIHTGGTLAFNGVNLAPAISSPISGHASGGEISLQGTYLTAIMRLELDGTSLSPANTNTDTDITFTYPAKPVGRYLLKIGSDDGILATTFTYLADPTPPTPPTPPAPVYYTLVVPQVVGVVSSIAPGSYTLGEDEYVIFDFLPEAGYSISEAVLRVNGVEMPPTYISTIGRRVFTLGYLSGDVTLSIEGVKSTTATERAASAPSVHLTPGGVVITSQGGKAYVYTLTGALYASQVLQPGETYLPLPRGIYLIALDNGVRVKAVVNG